jgi:hypothetical protein
MDSLEIACRYSYITNRLGVCSPKEAFKEYYNTVLGKRVNQDKIKENLKKDDCLYTYLEMIAKKAKKEVYDYPVIESYWTGNKLLEGFSRKELISIIKALTDKGLPKKDANLLIKQLPEVMNPHHSFNVLFMGVGKATDPVPINILSMNKCLVLPAIVLKITKRQLVVSVPQLFRQKDFLKFKEEIQYIEYNKDFLPGLKVNDIIGVHWDFACKILTKEETSNLMKYTKKNLDALNSSGFFSKY